MLVCVGFVAGCARKSVTPNEPDGIGETLPDHTTRVVSPADYTPFQQVAMDELSRSPREEIFALDSEYPGGGLGGVIEIVIQPDQAQIRRLDYSHVGDAPHELGHRTLDNSELAELRMFVAKHNIDHLPRQEMNGWDGVEYRWTHACGAHGWQVLINNPSENQHPHQDLIALLERLRDAKPPVDSLRRVGNCADIAPRSALELVHAGYERQRGPGFFGTRSQIRGLAVARTRRESRRIQKAELTWPTYSSPPRHP